MRKFTKSPHITQCARWPWLAPCRFYFTILLFYSSGQYFLDDVAVNVGQSEVSALVAVGQSLVVHAHAVQNRGSRCHAPVVTF